MTREEAIRLIQEEGLRNYNLNEKRYHREYEVGMIEIEGSWTVYATDERASVVTGSEVVFDNEHEAWDNLIKRLRAAKSLWEREK
ncbi:Imm59 family immunity protein [Cohnella sp. AR92]|uniref:Imm59 family immunity protein n=1 Tax=Cohnella sp. AR92 TaxID=648716 RepID=UPI000F8CF36B|nr:Imm59 family immunity protein [Cohnella sp. AR92]RUS48585.1 hypothetical protein ELR57_04000 [Cohnella sp. AR92]